MIRNFSRFWIWEFWKSRFSNSESLENLDFGIPKVLMKWNEYCALSPSLAPDHFKYSMITDLSVFLRLARKRTFLALILSISTNLEKILKISKYFLLFYCIVSDSEKILKFYAIRNNAMLCIHCLTIFTLKQIPKTK